MDVSEVISRRDAMQRAMEIQSQDECIGLLLNAHRFRDSILFDALAIECELRGWGVLPALAV